MTCAGNGGLALVGVSKRYGSTIGWRSRPLVRGSGGSFAGTT